MKLNGEELPEKASQDILKELKESNPSSQEKKDFIRKSIDVARKQNLTNFVNGFRNEAGVDTFRIGQELQESISCDDTFVQETRLKAFKDIIVYMLKEEKMHFNEDDILKKLDTITEESVLMELSKEASRSENIEDFLLKLDDKLY